MATIKATVWHKPIALATTDNHMNALDANVNQYPWHYGFQFFIESMTSMLRTDLQQLYHHYQEQSCVGFTFSALQQEF